MARPTKDGIDYFPMDVDFFADMKVRRVKKDCGPASISVLICLLCNIYRDGYYIRLNEDLPFVIAETTGVTEGAVSEIINKAAQVGFFDKFMLDNCKILTSKGIQKRFLNAVKASKLKRNDIRSSFDLLQSSEETPESSEETPESSEETPESSEESTQSKEKKRKGKKRKEDIGASAPPPKKRFVPPTLEEIQAYCRERNNNVNANRFFDYFNASGWIDSEGKPVRNWKQKIITWEGNRNGSSQRQGKSSAIPGGSSYDISELEEMINKGAL